MHELLYDLPSGTIVLDIGCGTGSFPASLTRAKVVRFDLEPPAVIDAADIFVRGDASRLPFEDHSFAAIISNHSLEHFDNLLASLQEIRRVTRPDGALFVAVPDTSTLSDRMYRFLARGGGHVNAFRSADDLARKIEAVTGLPHVATRTLCSSLSFLNRRNPHNRVPRRAILVGGGYEISLFLFAAISRFLDSHFHTRLSVYGWAFWFGSDADQRIDQSTWHNVCIRCGSGHPESYLTQTQPIKKLLHILRVYNCPVCNALNPLSSDEQSAGSIISCTPQADLKKS